MPQSTMSGLRVLDEDTPELQLNAALLRLKSAAGLVDIGVKSMITELQSAGDDFTELCQQAVERGYALKFDDGPSMTAVYGVHNSHWVNGEKYHGQACEFDLTSKGEVELVPASEVPDRTHLD